MTTPGITAPHMPRKRRVTLKILAAVLAAAIIFWAIYRSSVTRHLDAPRVTDTSCQDDQTTTATMAMFDPEAAPIPCRSWDIGTGVTGYSWTAKNPRGVVLLQVGWGDYAQRYVRGADQLIPRLLHEGLSVYAFDMYGNGRSPGRRGLVDVEQAVKDNLAARAKLSKQDLPVFLVGHSLGGLVTMTSAVRDQENLAGVVLLAPALKYDTNVFTRTLVRVGAFLVPSLPGPVPAGDLAALSRDTAAVKRMKADPMMVESGVSWLTASGGANVSHGNLAGYKNVTVPILAIHGTGDVSTQPTGSKEMIDAVSSKDKTFISVPQARHNILDDTDADQVSTDVLGWLTKHLPATGK